MNVTVEGVDAPLVVNSYQLADELATSLPDEARSWSGTTIGSATIEVRRPAGWSPWDGRGFAAGSKVVLTDDGTVFTGHVDSWLSTAKSDVAVLQCTSVAGVLRDADPVWPVTDQGDVPVTYGMHTQWVVEHLLSTWGLAPLPRPDGAVWWASWAGSTFPSVGGPIDVQSESPGSHQDGPVFMPAPWGLGSGDCRVVAAVSLPETATTVRFQATIDFTTSQSAGGLIYRHYWVDGFTEIAIARDGSGVLDIEGVAVDEPSGPGVFTVDVDAAGWTAYWEGVEVTSGTLSTSEHVPTQLYVQSSSTLSSSIEGQGHPAGGIGLIADPTGPPETYAARGSLGEIGRVVRVSGGPQDYTSAWAAIVDAVTASGDMLWFDGAGHVQAQTHAQVALATPTVTIGADDIQGLPWKVDARRFSTRVAVEWSPAYRRSTGTLYDELRQVEADETLDEVIEWPDLIGPIDTPNRRAEAFSDADGNTQTGTVPMAVNQVGPQAVRVRAFNLSGEERWFRVHIRTPLNPTTGVRDVHYDVSEPRVLLDGSQFDHRVPDETVPARAVTVANSPWRQRSAQAMADAERVRGLLVGDPIVEAVPLVASRVAPGIGDVVTLQERLFTRLSHRAVVVGLDVSRTTGTHGRTATFQIVRETLIRHDDGWQGDTLMDHDADWQGQTLLDHDTAAQAVS